MDHYKTMVIQTSFLHGNRSGHHNNIKGKMPKFPIIEGNCVVFVFEPVFTPMDFVMPLNPYIIVFDTAIIV